MINNRPNIFEFATKELSQDAVFCYVLDCFNDPEKKKIATEFLNLIHIQTVENIQKVEIRRQQDNIDIKAVVHYQDGTKKYIIIEDKVYSSLHDNQLQRYKEETIKRENCKTEDIIGVFFKLGEPLNWEKKICEATSFRVLGYEEFLAYVERIKERKEDAVLSDFCDFLQKRVDYVRTIDGCKFDVAKDLVFEEVISSRYGQRKLTQWMMQKIFDDYREEKMYDVNNYGSPCTQYQFIFDRDTTASAWDVPENEFPQRNYCCFFRVDRNAKGWYIAIRQYFRKGATNAEAEDSNQKREQILNILGIREDDAPRRKAAKEKTLVLFQINSVEKILQILPMLREAVNYLMQADGVSF